MRLLRTLAHLVLAVAILIAGVAQARVNAAPISMLPHYAHGAPTAIAFDHSMHEHGTSADERPIHKRDTCQTACCFAPVQLSARMVEARPVKFCAVRYPASISVMSSLTPAPEPGVPKHHS